MYGVPKLPPDARDTGAYRMDAAILSGPGVLGQLLTIEKLYLGAVKDGKIGGERWIQSNYRYGRGHYWLGLAAGDYAVVGFYTEGASVSVGALSSTSRIHGFLDEESARKTLATVVNRKLTIVGKGVVNPGVPLSSGRQPDSLQAQHIAMHSGQFRRRNGFLSAFAELKTDPDTMKEMRQDAQEIFRESDWSFLVEDPGRE